MAADKVERTCISVGVASDGTNSVLVVSKDDGGGEHLSTIFEYGDFLKNATRVAFQENVWIGSMWMSATGKYYLSEVLGSFYTNVSGSFNRVKLCDGRLTTTWGLHDKAIYAAGAAGEFFKFDGQKWSSMKLSEAVPLYAIHGVREDFLICVGDDGYVARWDGVSWLQVRIPTKLALRSVYVEDKNLIYFGGVDGACFRWRDERLEKIEGGSGIVQSIARWKGELYFGTHHAGVFKLNVDRLVPVRAERPAADMKVSKEYLYACGLNKYTRFDGTDWKSRPYT